MFSSFFVTKMKIQKPDLSLFILEGQCPSLFRKRQWLKGLFPKCRWRSGALARFILCIGAVSKSYLCSSVPSFVSKQLFWKLEFFALESGTKFPSECLKKLFS